MDRPRNRAHPVFAYAARALLLDTGAGAQARRPTGRLSGDRKTHGLFLALKALKEKGQGNALERESPFGKPCRGARNSRAITGNSARKGRFPFISSRFLSRFQRCVNWVGPLPGALPQAISLGAFSAFCPRRPTGRLRAVATGVYTHCSGANVRKIQKSPKEG